MNKRYIGYILYSIIGIIINIYIFLNNGLLSLIIGSLIIIPLFILTIEKFVRRFDFPLFFVRNKGLNYWSGAFGGLTAILFQIIGISVVPTLSILNMINFIFLFMSIFTITIILYTGSILRDIELGYINIEKSD